MFHTNLYYVGIKITFNIIDINFIFLYKRSMEIKFEIGKKIKNKRLQLNLRMEGVAKEVGITRLN